MLKHFTKALGVSAFVLVAAGTAQAATLNNMGEICEGPKSLLPSDCFGPDLPIFNDGPTDEAGPTIDITFSGSGSGTIFGGVRGRDDEEFSDRFVLDGTGSYKLTLTALDFKLDGNSNPVVPGVPEFDATWSMGGVAVPGTLGNQTGNVLTLMGVFDLTDGLQFDLTAAGGEAADGSYMEYRLDIQAVPLPAAAWMLLAGVGGLGAMSRRKKKAA